MRVIDRLHKQLATGKHTKNTQDCIDIYNWIKETHDGYVMESIWRVLVQSQSYYKYKPTIVGKQLLKSIRNDNRNSR